MFKFPAVLTVHHNSPKIKHGKRVYFLYSTSAVLEITFDVISVE